MKALIASFFLFTPFFLSTLTVHAATSMDLAPLYQMDIQIGEKLFSDIVEFKKVKVEHSGLTKITSLEGTLTVPGIFTVGLKGEIFETLTFVDPSTFQPEINFSILAREQGQEFRVNYLGKIQNRGILIGQALLEDGTLLGDLHAVPLRKQE